MIRFRNAMGYYDIHTHQMPFHKEDIAIINRIVSPMGDMQPGYFLIRLFAHMVFIRGIYIM